MGKECRNGKGMIEKVLGHLSFAAIKAGATIPGLNRLQQYSQWSYFRNLLIRLKINCVIDVGANRGQFARNVRRSGYNGRLLSFEPNREDFVQLSNLTKNDKLWRVFNIALGNENAERQFHVTKTTLFNSFLDPISMNPSFTVSGMDVVRTDTVQVKRLDSIMAELLEAISEPRVFLKLDTQGFDLEVVRGAEKCMDAIVGLQSELSVTPIYEHIPHYLEALDYYESLGFSLMNLFTVNRTNQQSILEYDCLMARLDELDG
jgi:FkbM family methyltransferase